MLVAKKKKEKKRFLLQSEFTLKDWVGGLGGGIVHYQPHNNAPLLIEKLNAMSRNVCKNIGSLWIYLAMAYFHFKCNTSLDRRIHTCMPPSSIS